MRLTTLAAGAAGLLAAGAFAAPAHAQDTAQVSVLHGVPGVTVDVFANGDELIPDFEPGTLAGPLDIPAGSYDLEIRTQDGTVAASASGVEVPGGANATVVAHLPAEGGNPVLTPFVNDTSETAAGEGRLTVRHVAAAPAVDILAGDQAVISGLTNPNEEVLDLPAGTVSAAVAAAGTTEPVLGPADVEVAEGVNTIVYAWGSLEDDNLALATQTIEGLHSAPGGVPAGEAGLVADSGAPAGLIALGGLVAAGAVALAWTRRPTVSSGPARRS